jgi:hypothetical protein
MENLKFTIKELYDLVWSSPIRTICNKYAITEHEIKVACKKYNIPTPLAGHWSKLEFGKQVTVIPLAVSVDINQEIIFKAKVDNKGLIIKEESNLKTLQLEIEKQLNSILVVPDRLTNPDKLIVIAKETLTEKDRYVNNGLVSCRRGELDIKVSKTNISRVLRFMDTFIKGLYVRGHSIKVTDESTYLEMKNLKIKISIREKIKRVQREQKNSSWIIYDYIPTGKLVFKVDETFIDREWTEGTVPFENQLSVILAKLEILADILTQKKLEIRLWHENYERERQIEKDFQKRKEDDLLAFKDTLNKAERWHKANNLRNYINEVESRAISKGNLTEEIKKWLIWARKKADWYDPFIELDDELLNDIDKETLTMKKKFYN